MLITTYKISSIYISMNVLKGALKKNELTISSHNFTFLHNLFSNSVTGRIIKSPMHHRVNFYPKAIIKYGEISSSRNFGLSFSSSALSSIL